MMSIPILIPAKGKSVRCPRKNEALLKYAARWLTEEQRRRTVVISDSDMMLRYAEVLGFETFYSSIDYCELAAMTAWCASNPQAEEVIYLPLTQPLRERALISRIESKESERAFTVSVSPYKDRTLFRMGEGGFFAPSKERKGRYCTIYDHVDGAIYKIKTEFLRQVAASENSNAAFWGAEFDTVENNMPFLDIDTPDDLTQLQNLTEILTTKGNGKST